jgi:hypothetical protein
MKISGLLMGVIMIVLGILVLVMPDLIKWFVAIGLIVMGILAIVRK